MGLTLIEAAKHETRVERLAVIRTFSEGQLIRRLPFRNLTGGALKFAKEKKLPRVGFRAVNEGYRRDYGAVANETEFVHHFAAPDVDHQIVVEPHTPHRGRQEADVPAPNLVWAIRPEARYGARFLRQPCTPAQKMRKPLLCAMILGAPLG